MAASPELNPSLFSISHILNSPLNLFPRFPLMFSQWHLTTDPASHSLSCLQHHYFSLSFPISVFALSSLSTSPEETESYPLSSYMTLHSFLDNCSNILKQLCVPNFLVPHLCKRRFQPISNKRFTGTLLYMQAQKKQSLWLNFPPTQHPLLSPVCHSLRGPRIMIRQFPQ